MRADRWLEENVERLDGKVVAVTGSTGGLGRELCAHLASLGASLVLLDRNAERSLAHKKELEERYGVHVTCVRLDLESIPDAERAVGELCGIGIDVFIHNAGAYSIPRHKCDNGYDNVFTINFATPYFMIRRLLPHLREKNGRVVAVGSIAHRYSRTDADDVDFSGREAASLVYGNAKRYLMFSLFELFRSERDVSLSVVHPGITLTNITAHYPKVVFAIIKHPMRVIFMSPKKASLCIVAGLFNKTGDCEWIGPRVLDVWGLPKKRVLRGVSTEERQAIARAAESVYLRCRNEI